MPMLSSCLVNESEHLDDDQWADQGAHVMLCARCLGACSAVLSEQKRQGLSTKAERERQDMAGENKSYVLSG
jgi:hypothetical protein